MGRLLDGVWITQDLGTDAQGRYVRRATQFRNQPQLELDLPQNQNRYLLLVGSPCGWSHRVLLVRALMNLQDVIPIIFTDAFMGQDGWTFYGHNNNKISGESTTAEGEEKKGGGGITAKELFLDPSASGYDNPNKIIVQKIHQLYVLAQKDYTGRASVPVLWDRKLGAIINNESSDLIHMLSSVGGDDSTIQLVPPNLKESIEEMIQANYGPINNGVYRCGFAGNQQAHDEAANALFERLDELETLLGKQRYLCSHQQITMADICLFPTLYRFDTIYYTHFKCNQAHIYLEYPNLWGWVREIYQLPGVADTCKMKECCIHYYTSHESIHPRRYIPLGPKNLNFNTPHNRDKIQYDKS